MTSQIPEFLIEMLNKQYGNDIANRIMEGYSADRVVTLRVNTLKSNADSVKQILTENNIKFQTVSWSEEALILENVTEADIRKMEIYENGEIYLQSLSSMIPAIVLEPKEAENILDMAAAPGGKTTQMAAISNGKALITACEKNKIRAERLKYNIQKQGASRVNVLVEDARKLNEYFSFDKVLLDAPCSGSGTISTTDSNLDKIFTKELVERSVKAQQDLLKKAIKILKPGQEMVYSTCSVLKEENEENIRKLLDKGNIEIVPINKKKFETLPLLPVTIDGTICIAPNELYEGFFVAKIRKVAN